MTNRTVNFTQGGISQVKTDVTRPPVPQPSGPVTSGVPDDVRQQAVAQINQEGAAKHFAKGVVGAAAQTGNYVKDYAVEVADSANRLGTAAGLFPGKDPYVQPGGGYSWGQMGMDTLPFLPYGKLAGTVGKYAIKPAARAIGKVVDEATKYKGPVLPSIPYSHTGDVVAEGAGKIKKFVGAKVGRVAPIALAVTTALAAPAAHAVERLPAGVVNVVHSAEGTLQRFLEGGAKDAPDALSRVKPAKVKPAEVKPAKPGADVKPGDTVKPGDNVKPDTINPGLTNIAPNAVVQGVRQQQATSQDKGPTDKGEQKPKKEEKPKKKIKKKRPINYDDSSGGGQYTTIPVIR